MESNEAAVVITGATGTGKSTFINLLTGDNDIHIGHDLESQTFEVNTSLYVSEETGHLVTLVDTPGFDDSRAGVSDTDILGKIAGFLQRSNGQKLNGIIYLHRISDPRLSGTAKKSLRVFRELCGDNNLRNVRIVTTYWDLVGKEEGKTREAALANGAFKPFIDGGARLIRHGGGLESARSIMSELVRKKPVLLKIQEELSAGRALGDTSAGAVIAEEMKELRKKQEMEMEDLRKEMTMATNESNEGLRAELDEERRKLEERMRRVEEDRKKLATRRTITKNEKEEEALKAKMGMVQESERNVTGEREKGRAKLQSEFAHQEREWTSQDNPQERGDAESTPRLKTQPNREVKAHENIDWEQERRLQLHEQAIKAELEAQKELEAMERLEYQEREQKIAESMQKLQAQLDQEKKAREKIDREREREEQRRERATMAELQTKKRLEEEKLLEAQNRERKFNESMQRLQAQLEKEKSAREKTNREREQERILHERATKAQLESRKRWGAEKLLEAQNREREILESMQKLQAQFDQEKNAREKIDRKRELEARRRERAVMAELEAKKRLEEEKLLEDQDRERKFTEKIQGLHAQLDEFKRKRQRREEDSSCVIF